MARSANFHSTELFVLCRRLEDRTRAHHKTFIILPYSYSISCLLKYFGEADLCHFAYCVRDSCPPLLCPLSYATVRSVCRVRAHIPSLGRVSPCIGDKRLKSVTKTHGQCDVRPTVTFPAVVRAPLPFDWYQIILLGDRGTCVCKQLAQGYYLKAQRPGVEPATFGVASPTPSPLRHQAAL